MKLWKDKNLKRWFTQGTTGILLTGAGICMIVEAGFLKHGDVSQMKWITMGTLALIVYMAGLTLFVDSIKYKIRFERQKSIDS